MGAKIDKLTLNKKVTFDDLDDILKPFFFDKLREYRKRECADQNIG
jgi:hypothetical protein